MPAKISQLSFLCVEGDREEVFAVVSPHNCSENQESFALTFR